MSLLSRFFYRRPPDGLLEFVDRVYVFDSCFSTEVLPNGMYQIYLHEIINELHEQYPDSSFLAFNFREGEKRSQFAEILCEYDVTVLDYPRQYEGCPLLPLSLIQHFLRVCGSWLSLGSQQNIILLHCERGGWPLLALLLASFLIFRKLHSGERKTLEIVHREAPKGFLQLLSPLNPFPSQLRYLQYVARRNISPEWPPPERALSLDCVFLRAIPSFDSQNGCRPIIRIFGRNLHSKGGLSTQMLFSMSKKRKTIRHYCQADCDVIKIDIQCMVQGDVVLECVHLDVDSEREVMMFRVMFNTAFIRSNILMLNCENLDILWDSKERYPKGFRAEVLFGDVESISPSRAPTEILNGEEQGGLPIEAFSRVQELFSGVEWVDNSDDATLWLLKQLSVLNDAKELSRFPNKVSSRTSPADSEEENNASSIADSLDFMDSEKVNSLTNTTEPADNFLDDPSFQDSASDEATDIIPSPPAASNQASIETAMSSVHQQSSVEVLHLPHHLPLLSLVSPIVILPCLLGPLHPLHLQIFPLHLVISQHCHLHLLHHLLHLCLCFPHRVQHLDLVQVMGCHLHILHLLHLLWVVILAMPLNHLYPHLHRRSLQDPPDKLLAPLPGPPPPPGAKGTNAPPPPPTGRGRASSGSASHGRGRGSTGFTTAPKKASLRPLHWVKVTRAVQGSLWADSQKQENQSRAPEIDISELESLFSAVSTSDGKGTEKGGGRRGSNINKPEKVQLVDLRRAYNCEIMLTKIKIPLPDMLNAILALDSSTLDIDQVENLIKFCPTKEEMELLKNYPGDKAMLGKCEQFFLELMKVPRVESKLRVFSFKITFSSQVKDLRNNLNTINDAAREVKESVKLRQIMQTILTLGNALNQGTARGAAIGFKLDSLLKLADTRARNNKMTLMHYLCKLLSEKLSELLDFDKDLVHLEAASKIQLKSLAEEMQAVSKGLEKVEQELTASVNDGAISAGFQKVLKNFLDTAEAEVRSLISLYSEVGRNADSLSQYFGEDPARCPFEQVTQILVVFIKTFNKSRDDNEKQADAEKKKLEKEAMKERAAGNLSARKEGVDIDRTKLNFQHQRHNP
ncbi:unnamed protein product, partial [Vitis vinifera]